MQLECNCICVHNVYKHILILYNLYFIFCYTYLLELINTLNKLLLFFCFKCLI